MISYSFIAVSVAAAIRGRLGYRVSARFDRLSYAVGEKAAVDIRAPRRFRPPAVTVRYGIPLKTIDGRRLPVLADPESAGLKDVPVANRGAYFAEKDKLTIRDAFGFFVAERTIVAEQGPRLIAVPEAKTFPFVPEPRAGGEVRREEPRLARTDELTESRRYLPGDDPRRINWKLYGHSGELFVKEGDPEPPPRSRYAVVVDSSVDADSFSWDEGGYAVDALAALALGLVAELLAGGIAVDFGATGLSFASGDELAAARYFAGVARYGLAVAPNLPVPTDSGTRIVLLALPRDLDRGKTTALDRFLAARTPSAAAMDLVFLNRALSDSAETRRSSMERLLFREPKAGGGSEKLRSRRSASADACVAAYSGKGGVVARRLDF